MRYNERRFKETFFTADLELFNKDTKRYREQIIKNWNEDIFEKDIVYVIGDYAHCDEEHIEEIHQITQRLNGIKYLILGNHDRLDARDYIKMGFHSVHTSFFTHQKHGRYFFNFMLIHDKNETPPIGKDTFILCGHSHSKSLRLEEFFKEESSYGAGYIDVGMSTNQQRPVPLSDIVQTIRRGIKQ
jgi:calcineurin-like phosphoesterase family protein